jgi:hypothetical protein
MKRNLAKTSLLEMIDLIMAQAGINREQAVIAFDAVIHYMRKHPSEPLHKAFKVLFGMDAETNHTLN